MDRPVLTDRSRVETYITDCQMKRYLNYHAYGTGIVPLTKNYHLQLGIAVHYGIALLMTEIARGGKLSEKRVDKCVEQAVAELQRLFGEQQQELAGRRYGIVEADGTKAYYVKEMSAVIEGMMRVWVMVEYPVIRELYTIVAVELDRRVRVDERVSLMYKADAIMVKNSTGEGVVYNIKTMKEYDARQAETRRIALQNFTEVYGAKRWLEKRYKKLGVDRPKIWNVRLVGFIKGWSKYNREMERFELEGPYTRYWKKKEGSKAQGPDRIAVSKWMNEYGEVKGLYWEWYEKRNSWKVKGGIKAYLRMFDEGKIYPGEDVYGQMIVVDGEQMVTDREMKEQVDMLVASELEVREKLVQVKGYGEVNAENWGQYKRVFTTNYNRCYYPTICEYDEFCNKGDSVKNDPFENGLKKFVTRKPHHEQEMKEWVKRGKGE